jgi:hypothetical protein
MSASVFLHVSEPLSAHQYVNSVIQAVYNSHDLEI